MAPARRQPAQSQLHRYLSISIKTSLTNVNGAADGQLDDHGEACELRPPTLRRWRLSADRKRRLSGARCASRVPETPGETHRRLRHHARAMVLPARSLDRGWSFTARALRARR